MPNPNTTEQPVKVEQRDRRAAVLLGHLVGRQDFSATVWDDCHPVIQALARHRQQDSERVAVLEEALRPFAKRSTVAEALAGQDTGAWGAATPEERIKLFHERKAAHDAAVLNARKALEVTHG
jgi:hypothetical protein